MRVYHLLSAKYGLEDLSKRRLKIAQLDDLNDPFELLSVELSDKTQRTAFRRFANRMSERFGVICFSRDWHHPVLWSHYAEKHKGMCLGFDVPDNLLLSVSYSATRLPSKVKEDIDHSRLSESVMRRILTTKFKGWKYEDEVRRLLPLEEKEKQSGFYFKKFSGALVLKEVILGPRCTITRSDVTKQLGQDDSLVRIIQARLAFKTFRVVKNRAAS
jgi:hypothetical protein